MNQALTFKQMENDFWNKVVTYFFGIGGGMWSFFDHVFLDVSYWGSVLRAGFTALVCAFCALCGKRIFTWVEKKWKQRKQLKK